MVRDKYWTEVAFVTVLLFLHAVTVDVGWAQTVPTAVEQQLEAAIGRDDIALGFLVTLRKRGIPITEAGLIETALKVVPLTTNDIQSQLPARGERSAALNLLAKLPKNPMIVGALREALHDKEDTFALPAMVGLQSLKETGWEDEAVYRILGAADSVGIALAGLLARAGRSEGWPVVLKGILMDETRAFALQQATYFEGLITKQGPRIDVRRDLEGLVNPSERTRSEIREALNLLPARQ